MDIDFTRAARHPVALEIFDQPNGVTVAHRDANGKLHGCRDISRGEHFTRCLDAWIQTSREAGLAVPPWTETLFPSA